MEAVSPVIFTNPKLQYENSCFLMKDNTIVRVNQYINDRSNTKVGVSLDEERFLPFFMERVCRQA